MAQLPGILSITDNPLREGATFRRVIRLKNKGTGQPVDLTGATALMVIKQMDADNALRLDASTGMVITNAQGGEITINHLIPVGTFKFFEARTFSIQATHQIDITMANGSVIPYLAGPVKVLRKL